MNPGRCRRLALAAIRDLGLDLRGLTVLTEAATGPYAVTPLIAALAGADRVLALARDSRHGSVRQVEAGIRALARAWAVDRLPEIFTDREDPRIAQADLVTNLGFVRPLDGPLIGRLKPGAVIPLMWETWEFRAAELDLAACRRRGIPVLGTRETHPRLRIFDYIGLLAVRLLMDLGIEILHAEIRVLGAGVFADSVCRCLEGLGAEVVQLETAPEDWRPAAAGADALVVAEHGVRAELLGPDGIGQLAAASPDLCVAHICGGVDREALAASGLRVAPAGLAPAGHMSVGTDLLGPRPVIDLHTAGLAVGAALARCTARGLRGRDAERACCLETDLADPFGDAP